MIRKNKITEKNLGSEASDKTIFINISDKKEKSRQLDNNIK